MRKSMLSSSIKIKIDKNLYLRLEKIAEVGGYSSTDEFITHVLGREAEKLDQSQSTDEEVEKRLRGLGYIE